MELVLLWTSGILMGLNSMISKFQLLLQSFSEVGLLLVFVVSVSIFVSINLLQLKEQEKENDYPP